MTDRKREPPPGWKWANDEQTACEPIGAFCPLWIAWELYDKETAQRMEEVAAWLVSAEAADAYEDGTDPNEYAYDRTPALRTLAAALLERFGGPK